MQHFFSRRIRISLYPFQNFFND